MGNPSKITTDLEVDDALVQNASFAFDAPDRQKLDNQIRGCQQHLVDCLIRGVHATYVRLSGSSAALVAGDTVCLASLANATEPTVTKSTSAALLLAGGIYGVVLLAAAPGARVLVAKSGALPPTLTSLVASAPGPVRVNTSTSRCEKVTVLQATDYVVGDVDNSGWLNLKPSGASSVALALASDFASTTSTSAQNTPLVFAVPAAGSWIIEGGGNWSLASGTAGAKLAINGPTGAVIEGGAHGNLGTGLDTVRHATITALATLTTAFNTVAATLAPVRFFARVKMDGNNAGNITFQVAPGGAVVLTLKAGFWLRAHRVAEI